MDDISKRHISHAGPAEKLYWIGGAFILGSLTGLLVWFLEHKTGTNLTPYLDLYVAPFGVVLEKMLHAIVIPLVFFTLLAGASNLDIRRFGRVGGKVIIWYLATSVLAAILGTALAVYLNPGQGLSLKHVHHVIPVELMMHGFPQKITFESIILNFFQNPFRALSEGNFLPVIVFAIAFGLALKVVLIHAEEEDRAKKEYIGRITNDINEVLFLIVRWIKMYAPIGIFALSVVNFSEFGPKIAGPYLILSLAIIGGIMFMVFVVYPVLIWTVTRKSPFSFFRAIQPVMITAFSTRSSAATLPISLSTAISRLRVRKELAEFSLPLGATINMDGVCLHLPIFAILAANVFGIKVGFSAIFLIVITTVVAAIGSGGIPGGSLMLLFLVLNAMGLDQNQASLIIAFALGINPILDMFETMNNTTGDMVCTYIVAEKENLIGGKE
ncbi:MAG: dicarboxylate/amino acid:cation symporter [Candidatus Omnitrophota bacterium]